MAAKPPNGDDARGNHPYRTYWLTGGLATIVAAIIAAIVLLLTQSPGSAPAHLPTASAISPTASASSNAAPTHAQAAFIFPRNYATNVPAACMLKATGTVRHLEKNHHLWLFLYFYDDKYWAGQHLTPPKDGHWSGRIFIGGDRKPGQDFVLWLFDLGPNGWTELNTDIDGQNNGFHGWRLANDVRRIAYIDFRTGDEKCRT